MTDLELQAVQHLKENIGNYFVFQSFDYERT